MSRDLTPRELHILQKEHPLDMSSITIEYNGIEVPLYSEEDIALTHKYPNLGLFGFDMLKLCKDILSSEEGQKLIAKVESCFTGACDDKELYEKTMAWYYGHLNPGYYMENNNQAMADYLRHRLNPEEN